MTKPSPEIEALAAQRLAADEDRLDKFVGQGQARRRQSLTLRAAGAEFWKHPSPWMIAAFLLGSIVARISVGRGLVVGAGDPGRADRAVPGDRVVRPRRDPALEAAHPRAGHDRLAAGP